MILEGRSLIKVKVVSKYIPLWHIWTLGILLIMRFSPLAWINLSDNFLLYFKDINPSCIQFLSALESTKAISVKENSLLITKVIYVCHFWKITLSFNIFH